MVRVGSNEYEKLPMRRKIKLLVERGYNQAAFKTKKDAETFARAWKRKSYNVEGFRSTGPTVSGEWASRAYYVKAQKKRKKRRRTR